MAQPIITITSDFGPRDYYAAAVSGRLLSLIPDARLITVSHSVSPYNIYEASFIIRNAYAHFPAGSIHLVMVNSAGKHDVEQIAVLYRGHYFVGPDSGIFGLIFDEKPEMAVVLEPSAGDSPAFPELSICTRAAQEISLGKKLEELGVISQALTETMPFRPVIENKVIKGMVIYIDNYHNVITNITRNMFERMNESGKYTIRFGKYFTERVSAAYDHAPEGELVAVFGQSGLLEIALYRSSAKNLLGIRINDIVRIEFE